MPSASDWRKDKPKRKEWRKRGPARTDQGAHTFVVQKPYCTPARGVILTALQPYEIPILNYAETVKMGSVGGKAVPMAQEARLTVPAQMASWTEYLLWSTCELAIVGGVVDPKNRERGSRRNGNMPTPWYPKPGEASIEPGCKDGHAAWQRAHELIEQAKKGRR